MKFELTKEFISQFRDLIENVADKEIRYMLEDLHPADIADVLDELEDDESLFVFKLLGHEKAADVLMELSEDARENLIHKLSAREIAEEVIDHLDSDDAADFMSELPQAFKDQVISHIEDESVASDIIDLLTYKEGTAGALMAKELIKVNQNWSVATCLREMRRQAEHIDNIYTIYVVDDKRVLIGTLSLKKLLLSATSSRSLIRELYDHKDLHTVQPDESAEEVANIMEKYDLVVLPVVSNLGILLGRITIDDVVDVIRKEAEKDYQMASGLAEDVDEGDSSWLNIRARLPWLIIGLFGGILGASVIHLYEADIAIYPEMAFFIPMIAAMGGNVGVQSAAIIVQGLANQSISLSSTSEKLLKELGIAAVNGIILSSMALIYTLSFLDSLALSYAVSISMLAVVIISSLFGTLIPLLLDRFNIDPALATGPFITTVNDIIGLFIYFIVGRMMYQYFEHGEGILTLIF